MSKFSSLALIKQKLNLARKNLEQQESQINSKYREEFDKSKAEILRLFALLGFDRRWEWANTSAEPFGGSTQIMSNWYSFDNPNVPKITIIANVLERSDEFQKDDHLSYENKTKPTLTNQMYKIIDVGDLSTVYYRTKRSEVIKLVKTLTKKYI